MKLQRFAENETFTNLLQPKLGYPPEGFALKGKWNSDFFKKDQPIVLELGCGRGEYTIGLARRFPDKNFIGIDIKGARLWRGAKTGIEENLQNVGFLRILIDQIHYFFAENEVSEIWITFPDPQPQLSRERKRLTHPLFLNRYAAFLKPDGVIHLKTDSTSLYEYTLETIAAQKKKLLIHTHDLYTSGLNSDILSIRTTYENIFLAKEMKITYTKFSIQ